MKYLLLLSFLVVSCTSEPKHYSAQEKSLEWAKQIRAQVDASWKKIYTAAFKNEIFEKLPTDTNYEVQLLVSFSRQGDLKNIQFVKKTNIAAIDAAAVQAFKQAKPFPAPPTDMIKSDGQAQIRWNFIVER